MVESDGGGGSDGEWREWWSVIEGGGGGGGSGGEWLREGRVMESDGGEREDW